MFKMMIDVVNVKLCAIDDDLVWINDGSSKLMMIFPSNKGGFLT